MNELDFDELDKAVNSLMSGMSTDKRNTALDDPEDKVVSLDASSAPVASTSDTSSTPASVPTPEPSTPADASANVPEAEANSPFASARPAQPLAVKRRGQFMDIVRPSSDTKSATPAPKREGVNLQPTSPFVPPALSQFGANEAGTELKPEPVAPVLDVVTSAPAEPEFPATSESKPEEAPKNEWPDPIEMQGTSNSASEATAPVEPEVPTDVMQEVAGPTQEEPLSSPFLPDAKVDKRPLGGGSSPDERAETIAPAEAAQPAPTVVALPDELKTDVMSLESTSTNGASVEPTPELKDDTPMAPEAKKEAPQTGSGSIPQQYSEQPSTGDRTNTPIYDTSTHNQPLGVTAKKSSPLKWIIFLIVLLILGAIAGAAYFYFTTQ
jgi:hypothetical protein